MKSDKEIQKDVMEELEWAPLLNATEVGVSVTNGIVTLTGIVDSFVKKLEAEKAAKRVYGVKAVAENIHVKLDSSGKKSDAEIAQSILDTLRWQSTVPSDQIKILVENGLVTLSGEVEWDYQRTAARTAVSNLAGVIGVFCNITIKPKLSPEKIKEKVTAAFARSANIDARNVNISTIGETVVLSGTVSSFAEKADAEDAAWTAPGVKYVENNIKVEEEIFAL